MKAKYLKPTIEFEPLMDELMIKVSYGDGNLGDGGSTSGKVDEGDARGGRLSTWDFDEE
jgi:hypothetical protein